MSTTVQLAAGDVLVEILSSGLAGSCVGVKLSHPLVPLNGILGHALASNAVEQLLLEMTFHAPSKRARRGALRWTCCGMVKDGRDKKVVLYEWWL